MHNEEGKKSGNSPELESLSDWHSNYVIEPSDNPSMYNHYHISAKNSILPPPLAIIKEQSSKSSGNNKEIH